MTYLDYAATTPMLPEVAKKIYEAEINYSANASALHTPGHRAMNRIEETRARLAKIIYASPDEIIFTSGSTESNNTVINIFKDHEIVVSDLEHHSIFEAANKFRGNKTPGLYSFMLANNETGEILDLTSIEKEAHEKGFFLHSDLTQVLGKLDIDVKKLNLDYATFSAHKIGGPVGVGALYIKSGVPFIPFMIGGNQEKKRRGGTYNVAGIIGFNEALKFIEQGTEEESERLRVLRDTLASRILTEIPGSSLNTDIKKGKSLPNILNASFKAAEGESIQLYLDAEGIIVSTGSACAAGDGKPSHVLMAKTGGDAEVAHSSVRFSFGKKNTMKDVDKVMEVLPNIINRLQKISTIN